MKKGKRSNGLKGIEDWRWGGVAVGVTYGDGVTHLSWAHLTTSSPTESNVCVCFVCLCTVKKCPCLQSTHEGEGANKGHVRTVVSLYLCVCLGPHSDRAGSDANTLTQSSLQHL